MSALTLVRPVESIPGYCSVPANVLLVVDGLGVNLFAFTPDRNRSWLFCSKDYVPGTADWGSLIRQQTRTLYAVEADRVLLQERLLAKLDLILDCPAIPAAERVEILQLAVTHEIATAFAAPSVESAVRCALAVGNRVARTIRAADLLPQEIVAVLEHDRNTYTHVLNVSILLTMLGRGLGIESNDELASLAMGGLLHDVGKRKLPRSILQSRNRLTREERAVIQTHPLAGYEELASRPDLQRRQLMMVYQHHEHLDGRGYPVGIGGDDIHPWAKMCAVIDVFEALTGRRPYREPEGIEAALEQLRKIAGTHLDAEAVECWITTLHDN